jgi:hypothetical protein
MSLDAMGYLVLIGYGRQVVDQRVFGLTNIRKLWLTLLFLSNHKIGTFMLLNSNFKLGCIILDLAWASHTGVEA